MLIPESHLRLQKLTYKSVRTSYFRLRIAPRFGSQFQTLSLLLPPTMSIDNLDEMLGIAHFLPNLPVLEINNAFTGRVSSPKDSSVHAAFQELAPRFTRLVLVDVFVKHLDTFLPIFPSLHALELVSNENSSSLVLVACPTFLPTLSKNPNIKHLSIIRNPGGGRFIPPSLPALPQWRPLLTRIRPVTYIVETRAKLLAFKAKKKAK